MGKLDSHKAIDRFSFFKKIYSSAYKAIIGSDIDFTEVSVRHAIFLLAVPMVLEMFGESMFAIFDIFYVSKLGADAVAVVGITESLITIIYAIGIGFSMATGAVVARRVGEKKPVDAAKAGFQAILTGIVISLIIAVPGAVFAKDILLMMGLSAEIAAEYYTYTAIIFGSNITIMLIFIINSIFRSAGDATRSMQVLWFANIINIILDPILIFGLGPIPAMGIKGAAIATAIGRGLGVLLQLYLLLGDKSRIKFTKDILVVDFKIIKNLINISVGGIGQYLIATASWIVLVRILSEFGSDIVAGYTIAIRIMMFAMLPSMGITNSAATLVGQNLGAKKPDRAEQSVWITSKINTLVLGLTGVIFLSVPEFWIGLFIDDPNVLRAGAICLQIISVGFFSYGLGMVILSAFNGAGDTKVPTIINLVCFWIIEIPLAYTLAVILDWREYGVFWAIVISETILTSVALITFRKGNWKLKQV